MNRVRISCALLVAGVLLGGPPAAAQTGMRLNYVNADVRDVIRSLASILRLNVLIAEDVGPERVTYTTAEEVPVEQLGGVLEAILESENLVLVQRGPVAQVMTADNAPATGPVYVGKDIDTPPPLGLITQVVPLEFISADEALAVLRQLASPLARFDVVPRTNGVLMTDHGSNIARYLELLRELDLEPRGESGLRTYVIRLQHASASELAATLAQVYGAQTVMASPAARGDALSDRSLSNTLETFRRRELDALATRRAASMTVPVSAPVPGPDSGNGRSGEGLVGRTTIVPDLATNSLVIRTEPPNAPLLRETVAQLDVRPPQVLLEVFVTEITLDEATQFGVNWSIFGDVEGVDVTGRLGAQRFTDPDLANSPDFILRAINLNTVDIRAILRALETTGSVRVLSTPHVLALNNEQARILVGSQVPFSQSTRTGLDVVVDRIVQYRDVGTQLTIIPTINDDGYVTFRLLQEVSVLTSQTLEAALNAPVISTREAETSAIVRNGETVVIGGLIDESDEIVDTGVPLLKDVPLLGALFRSRSTRRVRTELAMFVTPFVITSDEEAAEALRRTRERLRDPGRDPGTGR